MAKELPYFKFEPSEWDNGNIQMCNREIKGLFIDLCSMYWNRLGELPYALALQKHCNGNDALLKELEGLEIIIVNDSQIVIEFLDEQLNEFQETSEKRRKAANKRWKNASALQVQSKSNAIREEEIKLDERIKEYKGLLKKVNKKFSFKKSLIEYGFDKNIIDQWLQVRKTKKAVNTEIAFNNFIKEVEKRECNINDLLTYIIEKSWGSFKWEWVDREKADKNKPQSNTERLLNIASQIQNEQ